MKGTDDKQSYKAFLGAFYFETGLARCMDYAGELTGSEKQQKAATNALAQILLGEVSDWYLYNEITIDFIEYKRIIKEVARALRLAPIGSKPERPTITKLTEAILIALEEELNAYWRREEDD